MICHSQMLFIKKKDYQVPDIRTEQGTCQNYEPKVSVAEISAEFVSHQTWGLFYL